MKSQNLAKLQLISAMLIFGTIGLFVRFIPLPSGMIAAVRGIVGVLFLILVLWLRGVSFSFAAVRRRLPLLLISGVLIGFNWILLFEAYRYTTVSAATLCYYLAPILVMLASPLVLGERLTRFKLLCAAAALAGMVLVSGVLKTDQIDAAQGRGILCGVGAAMLYAGAILLNKKLQGISAYEMTIVQLGVAAVVLLPYVLFTEDISSVSITPTVLVLLAVVGVVHTGFAYALYFGAIQKLSAHTVAVFSYIDPIAALVFSALLLRERMGMDGLLGAIMILGAAVICERQK